MRIFDNYKIRDGKHKTLNILVDNRQLFTTVFHVSHIPSSKNLLETKKIIPNLIQDKSKLNSEGMKVIWLSPNSWNDGSLYGNIRFSYEINEIIKNKKFYAVEVMKNYNPAACRILITDKNHDKLLSKYNPYKKYDGPWHIDSNGLNYYNKDYNIEFMFEDVLDIFNAKRIDFVKHHDRFCNIYHDGSCKFLGKSRKISELIFVSHIIGNDILLNNLYYFSSNSKVWEIKCVYNDILERLSNGGKFEGNLKSSNIKFQICKSILDLIGKEKYDRALVLSKSLNSQDDLANTLRKIFCEYFNVKEDEFINEN